MAKTCKNCGEKLSEEALFCPNCGAPAEPCGPVNDDPVENFKANNSVPVPEAPVMSEAAPEKEQNAAGYTPAPEKIPEPEFATGPAPAPQLKHHLLQRQLQRLQESAAAILRSASYFLSLPAVSTVCTGFISLMMRSILLRKNRMRPQEDL